jgi:hypothetical protein
MRNSPRQHSPDQIKPISENKTPLQRPYNLMCRSAVNIALSGSLQYAVDLVVYMPHRLFDLVCGLVQTACTSLNVFFSSMSLTIFASKSEVVLIIKKHEHLSVLVRIGSYVLPQTTCFK